MRAYVIVITARLSRLCLSRRMVLLLNTLRPVNTSVRCSVWRPPCGLSPTCARAVTAPQALEIVFANSTPKGERDMYFSHFLQALAALATDKCETFEFVVGKVLHTEAPLPPSTPVRAGSQQTNAAAISGLQSFECAF